MDLAGERGEERKASSSFFFCLLSIILKGDSGGVFTLSFSLSSRRETTL